jgi:tryptophanyl-tRNA synthetase
VPGLDGSGKMGKSEAEGNAIFLSDSPEIIRKKVMKAVTDSGPTKHNQEKSDVIQNLFTLLEIVSSKETVNHFDTLYNNCQIKYSDLKKQLAEDIIAFTSPIREKIMEISADNMYLKKVVNEGTQKARESASKTIKEVKDIIGFKNF